MSSEDSCISASPITGKGAELELSVQVKGENEPQYTEIELSQTNSKIWNQKVKMGQNLMWAHDIGPSHKPCGVLNVSLKIQDNNMILRELTFKIECIWLWLSLVFNESAFHFTY